MDQFIPTTRNSLGKDLLRLGVQQGDVHMIHASVRSVGPVTENSRRQFLKRPATKYKRMEDASEMRTAKSPRQIRHMLAIFATLFGE